MSTPALSTTRLHVPDDPRRLVVLAPGLGTHAAGAWGPAVPHLPSDWHTIGVDLPGHGASDPWHEPPQEPSVADLAHGVSESVLRELDAHPALKDVPAHFAGVSLSGGLALQLARDHHALFTSVAGICTGPAFGSPDTWRERASAVRDAGLAGLRDASRRRWFADGFSDVRPDVVESVLSGLDTADAHSYAALCEALADYDLVDQLPSLRIPVLAVSGSEDLVSTPEQGARIAAGVADGRHEIIPCVAHQAPAESPAAVVRILADFFS